MKELTLPINAINEIYDYLSQRPYSEVHRHLKAIESSYAEQRKKQLEEDPQVDQVVQAVSEHREEVSKDI